MRMHPWLKIFCIRGLGLFFMAPLFSQLQAQSLGIETSMALGNLALHSPDLTERPQNPLWLLEASLVHKTKGLRYWEKWHRLPTLSLNARYNTYGLEAVYGSAFSLFPAVQWHWQLKPSQSLGLRLGSGLAYATRPFHRVTNPLNKGLSNVWNNITHLQLRYSLALSEREGLYLGLDLAHHSNGSSRKPNRGLNQYYLALGWQKMWEDAPSSAPHTQPSALTMRRWGLSYALSRGHREHYEKSGPRFAVHHQTLELNYRRNPITSITLGLDYEWHEFEEFFKLSTQHDQPSAKLRENNHRWGLNLGYEVGFGHLSIHILMGVNLGQGDNPFVRGLVYNRLKAKWYFLDPIKHPGTVYALIGMKSHVATAEYLSVGLGAAAFAFKTTVSP
jgi:hypothetical protein